MKNNNLFNKFESLPAEAQKQVIVFIEFLQKRYELKTKKPRTGKSLLKNKKFVGLWKNRKELDDSSSWIKNLREKEWREIAK